MRDGRAYLNFLSDFWTTVWGDGKLLSAVVGTQIEILNRLYLQAVAAAAPDYIDELPIFREDFWHVFALDSKEGETTFELPATYVEVPFLYNKVYNPTLVLRQDVDYTVVQQDGKTYVKFPEPPFANAAMPIQDLGDRKRIALFAPKVYTDERDLEQLFGHLTGIVKPTSEQYRQLIKGILFIYVQGPVLHLLNAGLNLACGYPLSRDDDRVIGIAHDATDHLIATEKGHTYRVPLIAQLSVEVGSPLKANSTFIQDIRVMDHKSEPMWWRGGPDGPRRGPRVVTYLSEDLVPQMDSFLRDDEEVIDYMFETYLKWSVMGLKVNQLALSQNFEAVEDFFRILYEMKPTYVSPYTQSYFKVAETWVDPAHPAVQDQTAYDAVEMVGTIELTRGDADDFGDAAEVWKGRARVQLGSRVRVGARKEDVKSFENTARDVVGFDSAFDLEGKVGLRSFRAILGSKLKLGKTPHGAIMERVMIVASIEPFETVSTPSERVQIVGSYDDGLDPDFTLGDALVS